jgi:hypothetical protein
MLTGIQISIVAVHMILKYVKTLPHVFPSIKFCNSSLKLVSIRLVDISLPTVHCAVSNDMQQHSRCTEVKPFEGDNYLVVPNRLCVKF